MVETGRDPVTTEDFAFEDAPGFRLRDYQREWMHAVEHDRLTHSRLLIDAPGGTGKTSFFAALAHREWTANKGRTLILENRDKLVRQTADRIRNETGLECEIEMAEQRASPFAPIVVASVASLGRVNRLTGFADTHFAIVVADEAHHSCAPLFKRVMDYFYFGADSLGADWKPPEDGLFTPKCLIVGTTATPDIGARKNLGSIYQKFSVRYSYLNAIEDGWLVGLKEHNIPVRIDTRKFRVKRTGQGMDFSPEDESAALIPIIEELAQQIVDLAATKKTMAFLPSLECARLMAEALNRRGLKATYVSGVCLDKDEKTEEFAAHGPGICLCLCALYVEGADFPDVDCVAWMRATISEAFYKQGLYRATRVLPGIVSDDMTAGQRRAAIAASAKPYSLIISPFFISDRIDICSVHDLFVDRNEFPDSKKKMKGDMTDPEKIRDFIAALRKAADKHAHKQARTIDPVRFGLSLGDASLANYTPETQADAAPATKAELDFLLEKGLDTTQVRNSGHAQKLIARFMERERLGLASPKMLMQLLLLGFPEDNAVLIKKGLAGVIVGKRIRYRKPVENTVDSFPA